MAKSLLNSLLNKLAFHFKYRCGFWPRYKFGVISIFPLIFYTIYDEAVWELLYLLRRMPLYCLITPCWTLTVNDQRDIAKRLGEWNRDNPRHRIIHLVPTEDEASVLRGLGLPYRICSHNALIDENIFQINFTLPKLYRAIYDARLTFFKRHQLASLVDRLALITYECSANEDKSYNNSIFRLLPKARWLNGPFSEKNEHFTPEQVAFHLNQAKVGLILSEFEGANYASIQYLLCGLPVVTTYNRGGRDAFFDPDYVVWSEDSPESVSSSVDNLIARNLDPQFIRHRTLDIMNRHRKALLLLIDDILKQELGSRFAPPSWAQYFSNKLLKHYSRPALHLLIMRYTFVQIVWRVRLKILG
jgi:hypothetical protein